MATMVEQLSRMTRRLLVIATLCLAPAAVFAQQPLVPLQLSFSDPGARSMGFGGAFVALADDATAAFANPAGLVQLLKPEVSIEGRYKSYSLPYTLAGRAEGLPSGYGIDTIAGVQTAYSDTDLGGLAFVSIAYPKDNWSFAFFRHQYADLEFTAETQGIFAGGTECCQLRYYDQRATSKLDIVNYGLSVAYSITDSIDVGLGLVYFDTVLESTVTMYLADDDTVEAYFAPNSYLPERSLLTQTGNSDETDWTLTAGLLWRLSESWRVAAVYRQGPAARIELEQRAGQAGDFGVPPGGVIGRATAGTVTYPDVLGLGFAYRGAEERLTVSFQWDRVEYSDIPRSIQLDDQTISDANELHLGAEYVFLESTPIIAARLGIWLEPDHQMRAVTDDPYVRALLPAANDETHYTAGLGIAMERFQIDFAVDFADRADTVSLSAIYSF